MGDAVMAIPALSALRAQFPQARITLLAKPPVAALFEHHPDIDRVMVYERPGLHAGLRGFWRLVRSLRQARFDLAFLLQNAFEAAFIAAAAGIPARVGYAADGRRFLLTHSLPKWDAPTHQCAQYLALLRLVGGVDVGDRGPQNGAPYLVVTEAEAQDARRLLESEGIVPGDRLVGIHPGAAYGPAKRWPPARFAAVADALSSADCGSDADCGLEGSQVKPVLFGSAVEVPVVQETQRAMKCSAVMLAGKTTVRQMMAVIARCQIFVSNDSGPMHVAAALGVPGVAIFGPTRPEATSPWGGAPSPEGGIKIIHHKVDCAPCTYRVCPIDHRCMTGVSVEEVVEAARKKMSAIRKQS